MKIKKYLGITLSCFISASLFNSSLNAATKDINLSYLLENGQQVEKILTVEDRNGHAFFENDIYLGKINSETGELNDNSFVLPKGSKKQDSKNHASHKGVIITGQGFRWTSGVVPFRLVGFTAAQRNTIRAAMAGIENVSDVRFVDRTNNFTNFVDIIVGTGCWSEVGMRGGRQLLSLGAGCVTNSTIQHELLHTLGFWHEQSRADRNNFVIVWWNNIETEHLHNFSQHISDGDDVEDYDFMSIMHYGRNSFSANGQPTLTRVGNFNGPLGGNVLSTTDIATLDFMYGFSSAYLACIQSCNALEARCYRYPNYNACMQQVAACNADCDQLR